jgi:hypothetical protein
MIYDTTNKAKVKGLPAVEIKMFALDNEYQDMSYSEDYDDGTFSDYLFLKLIQDIREMSENSLGIKFIILSSVPKAIKFYKDRHYFLEYEDYMINMYDSFSEGCTPLYMAIE